MVKAAGVEPAKPKTGMVDGEMYQDDGMWKFNWKGSVCGYMTKKAAELGLEKLSGSSKEET